MNAADGRAPRVARETRQLLATIFLSLAALWILARVRFPESPPSPNPVAPVLSQIAPRVSFDELARALAEVQPNLSSALTAVASAQPGPGDTGLQSVWIRFGADRALALLDRERDGVPPGVLASDPATGLAVLRGSRTAEPPMQSWTPRHALDYPRYLFATAVAGGQVYLRPIFFGPLQAHYNPAWAAEVWTLPAHLDVAPGSALFSTEGEFVGLVTGAPGRAVVPAAVLTAAAERLLSEGPREPGWLGIEVQRLPAALKGAGGGQHGVVVTWVDPQGPAAGRLVATDILESLGKEPLLDDTAAWQARVGRLAPGAEIAVGVRRADGRHEISLVVGTRLAGSPEPPAALGLSLRARRALGSEVLDVMPGSAALSAGLQRGDVLTQVAGFAAPTPAEVRRAFSDSGGRPVLVAVTRGPSHLVVAVSVR